MKSIKFFIFAMLLSCTAFGFSACSDNDDSEEIEKEIVNGKWTEQDNKLIYKITYNYGYGVSYSTVWTLTFNGDYCTKSECVCTFSSTELANTFYEAWKEEESYSVTKSGKTVTIDWTSSHYGMSKTDLKSAIGAMDGLE